MGREGWRPRAVPGWADGVIEGTEPDALDVDRVTGKGILESATNVVRTGPGRLAVRGGSAVVRTLNKAAGGVIDRVLSIVPYSQTGAIAVGHDATNSKHFLWRLSTALDWITGVEATSRHDLLWNSALAARPVVAELFEELYLCDGTEDFTARQSMRSVVSDGTVSTPTYNLDGDAGTAAAAMKPYCLAPYNSHLFVAGYDSEAVGAPRSPHLVRHSFLGRKPSAANGFDKDAYITVGTQGLPVRSMVDGGKNGLLVAKDNELYKITGAGRGNPGWQFALAPILNARGFGVPNPHALTYALGNWYGVNEAGPWICDGSSVDSLLPARQPSFRRVRRLDFAFVVPHPARNAILFGFNMSGFSGRSATYPFILWVWDLDSERWTGDFDFGVNLAYAQPIPSLAISGGGGGAPTGPTAAPSLLTVDDSLSTTSSVSGGFTIGDASAQTEIRYRVAGTLIWSVGTTVPAGVNTFTIPALANYTHYELQALHVKSAIYSLASATANAYTKLSAPGFVAWGGDGAPIRVNVRWNQHAGGSQLFIERKLNGDPDINFAVVLSEGVQPLGIHSDLDNTADCASLYEYRARVFEPTWPAILQYSAYTSALALACSSEPDPGNPS